MKFSGYMTRALRASDPRYVNILRKLGQGRAKEAGPPEPKPAAKETDDFGLEYLRSAYLEQKREEPDKRWGAARLKRELGLED